MTTAQYLDQTLKFYNVNDKKDLLKAYNDKRDEIKEALEQHFRHEIFSPISSGSLAKNTAVGCKFDYDLVVPFKKRKDKLEVIYDLLLAFFQKECTLNPQPRIRPQRVSIGLTFTSHRQKLFFDVTPGKEIKDYAKDGELNLFMRKVGEEIQSIDHITTNVKAQIAYIHKHTAARDCIRLLKIWKHCNEVPAKSFFLELLTIHAFEHGEVKKQKGLNKKLEGVARYAIANMQQMRLNDPGYKGNKLIKSLTPKQKKQLL